MSIDRIKAVLKEKIGLHARSIGDSSVLRAIEKRLHHNNLTEIDDYADLLTRARKEVDALIEEIVVPETWFFRNRESFECLDRFVISHLKTCIQPYGSIRILSFPCSTGEEPYSIAIQLSQLGALFPTYEIDAVDVSLRSLAKAKRGIFSASALRETDPTIRNKYFTPVGESYQVEKQYRQRINFKQGNFMNGPISPRPSYYDVIFCRNLLIYFDTELQQDSFEKLYRALKPEGLLILGHAESATITSKYFYRIDDEKSHAFRSIDSQVKSQTQLDNNSLTSITMQGKHRADWKKEFSFEGQSDVLNNDIANVNHQFKDVGEISTRLIEKLVLSGQYGEAEMLIDQLMQKNANNSSGYYLFALLKHCKGDIKLAESILKKAIYLEPNHVKSIELLIIIARANADSTSLSKYQKRLLRLRGVN